jgi:CheY-like chemotaxis protein
VGATVLVVDDDPGIQELLVALLEDEGYAVLVAGDGLEALDALAVARPDIIVLDMMMPRMDGYGFAEERRRRALHADVPVLLLTADSHSKQKAAETGAQASLAKPFSLATLVDLVNGLVQTDRP